MNTQLNTISKTTCKALTTVNGYKYYYFDSDFIYFQAHRGELYAAIKMNHTAAFDDKERLLRMRGDITE